MGVQPWGGGKRGGWGVTGQEERDDVGGGGQNDRGTKGDAELQGNEGN